VEEALDPSEQLWLKIQIRPRLTMLSLQLPKPAIAQLVPAVHAHATSFCIYKKVKGKGHHITIYQATKGPDRE
jgi:hypothetical protein